MSKRTTIVALAVALALAIVLVATRGDASAARDAGPALTPVSTLLEQERVGANLMNVADVGHVRGSADAPVTVIEFSDFGCPYCGMFALGTYPTLHEEYVETGKVQWRQVPFVMGMFPNGAEAAQAAECAAEQGEEAFWAMNDVIYERQTGWKSVGDPEPIFTGFAGEIGIDAAQFASCYQENRAGARVAASNALAERSGVRATPTFFVNGHRVQGALPLEQFRMILDAAAEQ